MNELVLNTVNQDFINNHLNSDTTTLLFKKHKELSLDIKVLIEQIEAKNRCKKKLPTWFNTPNIYYPNKLNVEQTSSEKTAKFKASIIKGESLIDLTGGFGVDTFYFSKVFKKVTHCEINHELSKIVKHNYKQLNIHNIETLNVNGIEYLIEAKKTYNWIYIDPSRRHESKGKVFFLKDCLPNVPEHLKLLFSFSSNILIKTSPLLDLSIGIKELNHVKTIYVIAVNNEVKELLWILQKDETINDIGLHTLNLKGKDIESFNFTLTDETNAKPSYSLPQTYLYEPNAAILKSGAFNSVSEKLSINKLNQNSHLYTSESLIEFPGRAFKIENIISYNKKEFKKTGITKANITTRNFPVSVEDIRIKLKVKDGGNKYVFATTNLKNQKILIICSKL